MWNIIYSFLIRNKKLNFEYLQIVERGNPKKTKGLERAQKTKRETRERRNPVGVRGFGASRLANKTDCFACQLCGYL